MPPISTFLNRILALPIALQNLLFEVFEGLMEAQVEAAIQAGVFDVGVETLMAESLVVTNRQTIAVHGKSGAETQLLTILRKDKTRITTLDEAFDYATASQKVATDDQRAVGPRRGQIAGDGVDAGRRLGSAAGSPAAPDPCRCGHCRGLGALALA